MENLFNVKYLEKIALDYKNKSFDFQKEIVDAFYIYEYIIKQVLPKLIKGYKNCAFLTLKYIPECFGKTKCSALKVDEYRTVGLRNLCLDVSLYSADEYLLKRVSETSTNHELFKSQNTFNLLTFNLLKQMIANFINFYELGPKNTKNILTNQTEYIINAPLYQVIDAFYSEWQRIDYEVKVIIEDYQEEYDIDRRLLLPGESDINVLKRKK